MKGLNNILKAVVKKEMFLERTDNADSTRLESNILQLGSVDFCKNLNLDSPKHPNPDSNDLGI